MIENREKLNKYLKELIIPKIKAGEHKEFLRQKLKAEYKNLNEQSKKLMFRPIFKYAFTFSIVLIILFGAYISKNIIEAHDGQLRVKNNKTGGCTFSFMLPTKIK